MPADLEVSGSAHDADFHALSTATIEPTVFQRSLIGMALALVAAGCFDGGAAKRIKLGNDLKILGLSYHSYLDANDRGPAGWQDLQSMEDMKSVQSELESAGYAVVWGLTRDTAVKGLGNTVVAYPRSGEKDGGKVLFFDGSVRQVTAADLTEMLKAEPAPE